MPGGATRGSRPGAGRGSGRTDSTGPCSGEQVGGIGGPRLRPDWSSQTTKKRGLGKAPGGGGGLL